MYRGLTVAPSMSVNRDLCSALVAHGQLEARLKRRMEHMGIVVTKLHEDERCLIPMRGVLPRHPQRTLGIGGSAGMVHPSTATFYLLPQTPLASTFYLLPQALLPSTCYLLPQAQIPVELDKHMSSGTDELIRILRCFANEHVTPAEPESAPS